MYRPLLTALLLGGCLLLGTRSGMAQTYRTVARAAAPADIPARLDRKFRRDAARLALRNSLLADTEATTRTHIDARQAELFYDVLTTCYRDQAAARDIANCNVHTFPQPSIDHLVIIFEREIDWAAPFAESLMRTNNEDLNALLDEHDLIIEKHLVWNDDLDAITIRAKEPLNVAALVDAFSDIDGVTDIDLGVPEVVGNDIDIVRSNNRWEVTYKLRFGALSGQPKEHRWTFAYDDDRRVSLVKEEGEPVPSYMRCATQDTGWDDHIRRMR